MSDIAFVAIVHTNRNGIESVTRVRAEVAEAYAENLKTEVFVQPRTVRILSINPANKRRLAAVGA